ncbi:MAG: CopG family transcriptional regulator [Gaiellaceae bacterium]
MKRLQIMIEEELDDALGREAASEGTSKAALIRRYVREQLKPLPPLHEDPLWEMVGADPGTEPVEDIDEFLYGPVTADD